MASQSPIDIDRSRLEERRDLPSLAPKYPTDPTSVAISYGATDGDVTPGGVVIVPQLIGTPSEPGAHVMVGETRFNLQSFHWHSPSEHRVDGKPFPLELHLVHRSEAGDLLVLGVLSDFGSPNEAIAPAFDRISVLGAVGDVAEVEMRLAALLPDDVQTFRYDGSLTTAPFTEGVSWFLCRSIRSASQAQVDAHVALVSALPPGSETRPVHSARPVQDLAGRTVVTGT